MKTNCLIRKITKFYIICCFITLLIYCATGGAKIQGEWDDYSLPTVSLLKEHNLSISENDIREYKKIFPEWSSQIETYSLSGFRTRKGGEIAFYFPVYSALCIPMVLILKFLGLSATYAFTFTNLICLLILIVTALLCLKINDLNKLFIIILLTINPIIFYLCWISAETFLYAAIGIAMIFWYNKWYKRAAFAISLAGMLNPTIMIIGIFMIADYFINMYSNYPSASIAKLVKEKGIDIIKYGCCFIIALVPMGYNYYNTGHINLTAAYEGFTSGKESVWSRFLAYLFDLNYGMLPYYVLILIFSFILFGFAIKKRHWKYIAWMIVFLLNVVLYSIMTHINSGMSGIARYNAWSSVVLLLAVGLYSTEVLKKRIIPYIIMGGNICILCIILHCYGPYNASNTSYVEWTPIAKYVLDNYAPYYNPLYSTFNSRTIHQDGGYVYETPIVYTADDGYIRKMLVSPENKQELMDNYIAEMDNEYYAEKIANVDQKKYLSFSKKNKLKYCPKYYLGDEILFYTDKCNMKKYVKSGIYEQEESGTWTKNKKMKISLQSDSEKKILHATINAEVYNKKQNVLVLVNGQKVFENNYTGGKFEFDFENPGAGKEIELVFEFPDACSPAELGESADERTLALYLRSMVMN